MLKHKPARATGAPRHDRCVAIHEALRDLPEADVRVLLVRLLTFLPDSTLSDVEWLLTACDDAPRSARVQAGIEAPI